MNRRVYYLTFFVFSVMAILLPTLTRQSFRVDEGYVLGSSCDGVNTPRSDIDCDGKVKISDFSVWLGDYREALKATPVPVQECEDWTNCVIPTVIGWSECNEVDCIGGECVFSYKPDGTPCSWEKGEGLCRDGNCGGGQFCGGEWCEILEFCCGDSEVGTCLPVGSSCSYFPEVTVTPTNTPVACPDTTHESCMPQLACSLQGVDNGKFCEGLFVCCDVADPSVSCTDEGGDCYFGDCDSDGGTSPGIFDCPVGEVCCVFEPTNTPVPTATLTISPKPTIVKDASCGKYGCDWCGRDCVLVVPGMNCLDVMPPKGETCECVDGECKGVPEGGVLF